MLIFGIRVPRLGNNGKDCIWNTLFIFPEDMSTVVILDHLCFPNKTTHFFVRNIESFKRKPNCIATTLPQHSILTIMFFDKTEITFFASKIMCQVLAECILFLKKNTMVAIDARLNQKQVLQMLWARCGSQGMQNVSKKCLKSMLRKLHFENQKSKWIKILLKKSTEAKDFLVSFEEFGIIAQTMCKKTELDDIFGKYCLKANKKLQNYEQVMTFEELANFFKIEQNQEITEQDFGVLFGVREKKEITKDEFESHIFSLSNEAYDKRKTREVYQDMSQPLSSYHIFSSHNTYVLGHQLYGISSVEGYASALLLGCRCVELDLWDGPDGEPVLTHGYTAMSKILFSSAIETIVEKSFMINPWPVILTLEMHCSSIQQIRIANILKEKIGLSRMYLVPQNLTREKQLPSPLELKNKFIIRTNGNIEMQEEEEEDLELRRSNSSTKGSNDNIVISRSNSASFDEKDPKKKKTKIIPELNSCLGLISAKLNFENKPSVFCMTSLPENKIKRKWGTQFIEFTRTNLVRVYPKGIRINSSNFNPFKSLSLGCQVVALNLQTTDNNMKSYLGFFSDNGLSGYLLKHKNLLDGVGFIPGLDGSSNKKTMVAPRPWKVQIKLISGFNLGCLAKTGPKATKMVNKVAKKETMDPFVKLKVKGLSSEKLKSKKWTSGVVNSNGFHPIWAHGNEPDFQFEVQHPEYAVLVLTVFDKSMVKDTPLGFCSVKITNLRHGYRVMSLLGGQLEQYNDSFILLNIKIAKA